MSRRDHRLTVMQDSLCGAISGITARTVTAPLDVTKVLYQVGVPHANQRAYLGGGWYDLVKFIKRTEGARGLFKGNFTSCVKMFPASTIHFAMFFSLRKMCAGERGQLTLTQTTIISASAGYASVILTYPIDTIKTRLIAQTSGKSERFYKGLLDCCRKMVLVEGYRSLWRGLSAALLATVPSTVALFVTYEILQRRISLDVMPGVLNESVVEGKALTHGFIAAFISLFCTHPLDTCRKKMQAYSAYLERHGGVDFKVKGLRQCLVHIWRTQWWLGLYAGFAPAAIRLFPFNLVLLGTYVICKRTCLHYNGVTEAERRRVRTHLSEDIPDLEYLLEDNLLDQAPPTITHVTQYISEQHEMKLAAKNKKQRHNNILQNKNEK